MPWYIWVVIGNLVFSGLYKVAIVGKPRKVVEPWEAVGAIIEVGLMIWAIVAAVT